MKDGGFFIQNDGLFIRNDVFRKGCCWIWTVARWPSTTRRTKRGCLPVTLWPRWCDYFLLISPVFIDFYWFFVSAPLKPLRDWLPRNPLSGDGGERLCGEGWLIRLELLVMEMMNSAFKNDEFLHLKWWVSEGRRNDCAACRLAAVVLHIKDDPDDKEMKIRCLE